MSSETHIPDGLLSTIYKSCKDDDEWQKYLSSDPYISKLKTKWDEWVACVLDDNRYEKIIIRIISKQKCIYMLQDLPFTQDEINYLNSRLIDGLYKGLSTGLSTGFPASRETTEDEDRFISTFDCACNHGYLETVEWLYNIRPSIHTKPYDSQFINVCANGHLCIVEWMDKQGFLPDKTHEIWSSDHRYCIYGRTNTIQLALADACINGHLDIAEWIYNKYTVRMSQISSKNTSLVNIVFRYVCENGHLDMAKWMLKTQPIEIREISMDKPFRKQCMYGNLQMCKWLQDTFKIVLLPSHIKYLISRAHKEKQTDIEEWLKTIDVSPKN